MDSLYSSPPYAYLPPQNPTVDNYHPSTGSLYRSTTNNAFDRSFHMEDHHHHPHHHHGHDLEPYHHHGWSSSSNHHSYGNYYGSNVTSNNNMTNTNITSPRPKITTNLWEDEGTLCYQVDAKGICVARRQDNDMVNGTKLLNVVGMSRGKRDGILKNEKGRVVVKVGAMHLKGVWIPFTRATELAEKFKILDLLYPLFVDEPSIYLCNSSIGAAHNHSEVIPSPPVTNTATNNKCNMIPSPLPFSHRSSITNDDYSPSTTTTLPSWDSNRPYSLLNSTSSNQYDSPQQVLHRNNSNPDLSAGGSPVPRSVNYNHHSHSDENDLYLLNNHHGGGGNTTTSFDYYNSRPFNHHHHNNRGSFSSVSSHQSYIYSSLQHQQHHHEDDASKASSVTTPTSYMDNNSNSIYTHPYGGGRSLSQDNGNKSLYNTTSLPYIKSSPYTASTTITSLIDTTTANNNETAATTNRSSAGSTTPSSWFSPETPTAVLFQQVKEETEAVNTKKRKASSASIEIGLKTLKKHQTTITSPTIRATKKLSTEEEHNNDD